MSLKHAILAAISSKPRTGYDLGKKIDGSIGFFWSATHQQIYKELKDLELEGWVTYRDIHQTEKPDKKIYRITTQGLKALKTWIREETVLPPTKDSLLIKIFAGKLVEPQILIEVLATQTRMRANRLKRYLEIEKEHFSKIDVLPEELQFQYLTLRRGIISERSWLDWAEETRSFLERRKSLMTTV